MDVFLASPGSNVAAPLEDRPAFCPIPGRMTRRQSPKTGFKIVESSKIDVHRFG